MTAAFVVLLSGGPVGALTAAPSDSDPPPGELAEESSETGLVVMDSNGRVVASGVSVDLATGDVMSTDGSVLFTGKGAVVQTAAPEHDLQRFSADVRSTLVDGSAARAICAFDSVGDYVHVSSGQASGHGWWVKYVCDSDLARVRTQLQSLWTNGQYYWWANRGTQGDAVVPPGGGAGKRATGKANCDSTAYTGWRSVVDVDVLFVNDPDDVVVTATRNLYCRKN